ncbi:MAG: STAS domain-containing protein, partial [Planctomycetota bacterium]
MASSSTTDGSGDRGAPIRAPQRLSEATGGEVLAAVRARLAEGARDLAVDLGGVEAMDSRGAAYLQLAAAEARRRDAE